MIMMSKTVHIFLVVVLVFVTICIEKLHGADTVTCYNTYSKCFLKYVKCPPQCPSSSTSGSNTKVCTLDCTSPICTPQCKHKKPTCTDKGAACLDPRFIGGDGSVFYFHGKSNQHFTLVTDHNLQINAKFIGLRPAGRPRDYTWIQELGVVFDLHTFSVEATKATTWDQEVDHLKFIYNGVELYLPKGQGSMWESKGNEVKVQRLSDKNSAIIYIPEIAEISVNVIPVTKEDDRIHNYQIPSDDCFAHLEIQFRFYQLSDQVEGVLGKTYQLDFVSTAKPGVAMPVVGGEDKYRTTSLLSTDCKSCIFSTERIINQREESRKRDFGGLDCTGSSSSGVGILCRK